MDNSESARWAKTKRNATLPVIGGMSFWLLLLGFALLVVATAIDGL